MNSTRLTRLSIATLALSLLASTSALAGAGSSVQPAVQESIFTSGCLGALSYCGVQVLLTQGSNATYNGDSYYVDEVVISNGVSGASVGDGLTWGDVLATGQKSLPGVPPTPPAAPSPAAIQAAFYADAQVGNILNSCDTTVSAEQSAVANGLPQGGPTSWPIGVDVLSPCYGFALPGTSVDSDTTLTQ